MTTTTFEATPTPSTTRWARALYAQRERIAYRALAAIAGLMFAFHGAQGLFGWFLPPGVEIEVASQAWFGGIIELVTGLAIAANVRPRAAAFLASGTMAVAYIQFHWKLALDAQFLPAVNQGELALLYAFVFLMFAARRGGKE